LSAFVLERQVDLQGDHTGDTAWLRDHHEYLAILTPTEA